MTAKLPLVDRKFTFTPSAKDREVFHSFSRGLCPQCKKPLLRHEGELGDDLLRRVKRVVGAAIGHVHIAGPGCDACRGHGTVGRTVVAEIVLPDAQFFEYIRAGQKIHATEYWLRELNGHTFLEHAIEKIAAGIVDPRMAEKTVGHLTRAAGSLAERRRAVVMEAAHAV